MPSSFIYPDIALIPKRKSRSRRLRATGSSPATRYKNPIASGPSPTNSSSDGIAERLVRIEENYDQLDKIWADIESRIDFGDETLSPPKNKKPR